MEDVLEVICVNVKKDLLHESRRAIDLKSNLTVLQGEIPIPPLEFEENKKLACYALKCYLSDLKESVKTIKEKLGGADIPFEHVKKEISLAEKAIQDYNCLTVLKENSYRVR